MKTIAILIFSLFCVSLSAQMVYPDDCTITGAEEVVFDWTIDNCETEDIPDNEARFFRDADGNIQMIAGHYDAFRMIGPDFNNLVRDCANGPVYESNLNSSIGDHDDHGWIHSLFTYDGATIYAYIHNEWHGHNYGCPGGYLECWYNSITFATSTDSGKTYTHDPGPDHLALAPPYEFDEGSGPGGYFKPSDIVLNPRDGYYYMLFQIETIGGQDRGTGIVRTLTPEDPTSWLGWDGTAFTVDFVDIYNDDVDTPAMHAIEPLDIFMQGSLSWNTYFEKWMVVGPGVADDTWGFYYRISDDLISWSAPKLILESNVWTNVNAPTNVDRTLYGSVIDHDDTTRNFTQTGRDNWLYYTRWHPGSTYDRDLVRVPFQLNKFETDGWTVNSTASSYDARPGDGICESEAGGCTVLAALQESNMRPASHADSLIVIGFDIPSGGVISLDGPAGGVNRPVVFDGSTQDGYVPNTAAWNETNNAQHSVIIDFNNNEAFEFNVNHCGLKGIQFRNTNIAVRADSCFIEGCFIQTDGAQDLGINGSYGVVLYDVDGTRIGGENPEQANIILRSIWGDGSNSIIQNNKFDTNREGNTMLVNEGASAITFNSGDGNSMINNVALGGYNRAISLENSDNNLIDENIFGASQDLTTQVGGYNTAILATSSSSNNIITNNVMCPQTVGVAHLVLDQAANNNIINGNFINTDTDGNPMTTNDGTAIAGVFIGVGCSDNQIGGTLAGEGNTISGVGLHGLVLLSTAGNGNSFRGNTIFGNGGLGIDRGFDWWPNENDAGDADAGPNDGINHPVIEQVAESGDDYIISILVDAAPSTTYVVDLYANAECDDSEYGEGRYYITSIEMTTDGSGQASVDYTHTPEAEHAVFSALMTNVATNNSSEFGPCVAPVSPDPNIVWSPTAISKTIIAGNSDSEQLFIENTGVVPLTYEVSTDQDWIIPTETSGTLNPGESSAQYITFDAANLPGDEIHGGNIYITSNDPDTPEVEIPVLVEVNYTGMFEVSEEVVFLSIATGQQTTYGLTITNNGTENVTWSGSTDVTANWLTQVLPSGGTLDADGGSTELDVHINTNGVSAGNYVGVVIFNSNASLNPTLVVEFNLNVTEGDGSGGDNGGGNGGGGGGGGNPIIAVNPMNLNFFVEANSNATIPFTISNDGSPNLQWNVSTPVGDSWLSVNNPPSGSIPPNGQHNTFAAVNTNGLSEGSYTSSITITSNATNSPELIIPVSLTVDGDAGGDNGGGGNGGGGNGGNGGGGNGGDTPIINVTPEAINFFADANSNATQPFTISNDGSPNLQWNISTPAQDTWLNVNNPPSGSIPPNGEHNTFAAANTNGLSPGTYNSSITITSNASNASELVIPVTLTVNGDGGGNGGGGNSGPAIAVIPNLMEIELAPGELGSYDFDIINNGDEDLQWMLSTFIPDTWISNGMPQNGVLAPGNIATSTVEIDTNELDPGDYYSEVMVSSNAVNAEIFLIEVYLTVTDDNNGGGGDGPVAEVMTTSTELCPGSDFEILWNVTSEGFGPANTFVVQLSDADGGFSFPSILGEFQANTGNGSEWMTVPLNIPLGFNYRIRLEATNPASVGPTSGDPLTIFPAQAVSIPELPVLCSQEGQFELPQGEPSGGFYEGDFVTNNIFSPSQAGLGMHEITYNHYSPEGCLFQTTTMVEVNDAPSVALVEVGDMCTNSVAVNLSATPMGGVWSGPGVDGGMFYPELANAGTHTLHYEYSNAAGCMAEGELTVNVYDLPEITMYPAEPACQGQGLVNLPEVSPAGGTFWGEFVTGDQFDADQAPTGSYTINYSYTAESGCVNTAVTSLDVNPTPEPFMDLPLQICANAEAHHMDPNPVGGIFEGEGTDGSYFVPTMVDPGTYDVTYMAVNVHGCIGMVTSTIEVVETPMVELMMPTSVCQSEGIIPLDFGTPEGGQYTIDGVLVSTLDVSDYEPGYHEVAYYVENGAGCEGFAIDGLNIEAAPETPEITFDGTTISVFNPNNYEIQWYLNGTPITQEGNAFIPVESGVYTVTLASDFCTSMLSNEVDVTITGIEEMTSAGISVYPVPFSEEIIIEASAVWSNEPQVRLYDANARLVYIWNKEDLVLLNGKYIINTKLALLPSGMYYLILDVPGNSYRSVITK